MQVVPLNHSCGAPRGGGEDVLELHVVDIGPGWGNNLTPCVMLHIDNIDITEIDIGPPYTYQYFDILSINIYISMSWFPGFAQSILQKNTAHTL